MRAREKLERLTRLHNKSATSLAAGLGHQYLFNVLSGIHNLGARPAVALAKVLEVDPGWLLDDSRGWPPLRIEAGTDDRDRPHDPEPIAA
jgi:hypothetical protein